MPNVVTESPFEHAPESPSARYFPGMTLEFTPAPVDIPDTVLDDLRDAPRAHAPSESARRRQLADGHRARIPRDTARLLEGHVRLARARGTLQRVRTDYDGSRRPAHPLPPRALAGTQRAARCSSRTAGPVRSPSSSTCSARSRIPARTAVIRPTPSTWSRHRSRATGSPVPRTNSGWNPRRMARSVHPDHVGPRLRPLRRAGRRLGFDRVAERRRSRPRARVRFAPQLHHGAATERRAGPDARGAAGARRGDRVPHHRRRLPGDPGHEAADASATRSKTRRRACARGSSRSSPRGPTATATSNASSRRTSCSPTSRSTGRPQRPRRRRGCTTRCDRPGASAIPSAYVGVPTGVANYPGEVTRTPRSWAEHRYNITHWTEQPHGGHFAAMQVPDLFVADVREFFRTVR